MGSLEKMSKINKPKLDKEIQQMSDDLYVNQFKKVMQNAKPPTIVRSVGELNKVESDGKYFYRVPQIPVADMGEIKCAPYDNHFIYKDSRRLGWVLFCTCGSPAVVVGYEGYRGQATNEGALLVCMFAAMDPGHKHNDGSSS
jgi:hypothetical protein